MIKKFLKKLVISEYIHIEVFIAVPVIIYWSYLFTVTAFK